MKSDDYFHVMSPVHRTAHKTTTPLVVLCVTVTLSRGALYYAFPVLALPISADTGWPLAATMIVFSVSQILAALAGIPVGRWMDRKGPRAVMTLGAAVAVPALVAVAFAPNLWCFAAGWLVAGSTMAALSYSPAFAALTRWHGPNRMRALTTLTLVAGLASTVFAPLAAALDHWLGWRETYLVMAAALLVTAVPLHAFALRLPWFPSPERPERTAVFRPVAIRSVLRSRAFVLLSAALTLSAFGIYAVPMNLVPLLAERDLGTGVAAWVLGIGGVGQLLGRLAYSPLHRRASTRTCSVTVLGVGAATILLFAVVPGPVTALFLISALAGGGRGLFILLQATAVSDRWGTAHYGTLSGILQAPATVAIALGPGAGTLLAGLLGSYPLLFTLLAAVTATGALLAAGSLPSRT